MSDTPDRPVAPLPPHPPHLVGPEIGRWYRNQRRWANYVEPPRPRGGTTSTYVIPDEIGGDRSMEELFRQRQREAELERLRREYPELVRDADGNYPPADDFGWVDYMFPWRML